METYRIEPIETERLILREVTLEDAAAIYDYASCDSNIEYMLFAKHQSVEETRHLISKIFLARPDNKQFSSLVMELKTTGQVIGMLDFTTYKSDMAELGYILHRDYWRSGYAKEASKALVDFGFNKGIRKFICRHHPDNIGSKKVMLSLGFVYEGVQRQENYFPNAKQKGYSDVPIYSLLKEDFYE